MVSEGPPAVKLVLRQHSPLIHITNISHVVEEDKVGRVKVAAGKSTLIIPKYLLVLQVLEMESKRL